MTASAETVQLIKILGSISGEGVRSEDGPERFSNDLSSKIGHLYFDCFEELELGELSLASTGSTQSKNSGED